MDGMPSFRITDGDAQSGRLRAILSAQRAFDRARRARRIAVGLLAVAGAALWAALEAGLSPSSGTGRLLLYGWAAVLALAGICALAELRYRRRREVASRGGAG